MSSIEGSGFSQIQRLFQFRIKPNADLLQAISEAVSAEGISAGVFVSGLGALKRAVFRNLKVFPKKYPVTNEERLYLEVTSPMELVSLTGWIAPKAGGGVEVHAHFAASTVQDETVVTIGGHLTEGTICGIKCVIAVLVTEGDSFQANQDKKTKAFDLFFNPRSSMRS
ncbi:MAG: DNA-binding protein [Deltaproteobacteria bacterium]|nr:DNA-binding protein [Deltaproteobacteria bacterium]